MNSKSIIAVAALAAAAFSGAASAAGTFEVDGGQSTAIQSNRTRAEVMAEAARVPATRSTEVAGSRATPLPVSGVEARVIRAQAAEAVRLGKISSGEIGL